MLGEGLALGSAIAWSSAVILFKKSEGGLSPHALNLYKNVVGAGLLVITLAVLGQGLDAERSGEDWWRLIVSGLVGIALADTLFFVALRRLGPGLLAIVETTYAPAVVLLSVIFLDESLTWIFGIGALLVVAGLFIATYRRGPAEARPEGQALGVVMGIAAIVFMGFGLVIAKPALDRGDLLEVTLVRLLAGIAGQLVYVLPIGRLRREAAAVLKPNPRWKTLFPAAFLGTYLAMICWLGGMKYTLVSIASVLGQLSGVFTLVLARIFLAEPLTAQRVVGAGAAVLGAILVILG